MLVTELLDLGESPNKRYDWNENLFSNAPNRYQMRRQINNMSCESVEFNEEDMDENGGIQQKDDCEVGDNISDQQMAIQSNLEDKMRNMQGYQFNNNENFKAMKKIIPLLDQAQHVEIKSDTILKEQEEKLEYESIIKQESVKYTNKEQFEKMMQAQNRMVADQLMQI